MSRRLLAGLGAVCASVTASAGHPFRTADSTRLQAGHAGISAPPSSWQAFVPQLVGQPKHILDQQATAEADATAAPNLGQFFSVLDFGAVPDGVTDNTHAFQSALNATSAAGGTVWAPTGRYRFEGTLVLPPSTVLQGVYKSPPAHNAGQGPRAVQPVTGTVLMPTAGRGNTSGQPFLTLNDNSAVAGMSFFYPDQVQDASPQPYPWTVSLTGENAAVMDVELLNSYNGIRAYDAPRHYIARVQGQPTNIGISVDAVHDIGRIENVHFNPWYSTNHTYMQHQLMHGTAFSIGRTDWQYMFNTFVFGMAVGYHFVDAEDGPPNGNFVGIGADMTPNASVLVDDTKAWGIAIVNGEFTSYLHPNYGNNTGQAQTQVVVRPSNTGTVRFTNSAFWGQSPQIASIEGTGSVGFTSCIFNTWRNKSAAALHFVSGDAMVIASEFQAAGIQVHLGQAVTRAVISSNIFTGPQNITNDAAGDVQVGLNAAA